MARSRWLRNAAINAPASEGNSTRGKVRGVRISGVVHPPAARADGSRCREAPGSPSHQRRRGHQVRVKPDTDASRRLIVRADKPASPSSSRTTLGPRQGARPRFDEDEHVRRGHRRRLFADDREEHLPVMGN